MTPTPDFSSLVKAADVFKSLFATASNHAPFLIAWFFTFAFISFTPASILPAYLHDIHWIAQYIAVFLGVYIVALHYYSYRSYFITIHCLNHLGEDERSLIRLYLKQNVSCMMLSPILNGPCATLIAKGVLTVASGMFPVTNAPVLIQPIFQQYLRRRPSLVGLAKEDIGKDKRDSEDGTDEDGF